MIGSSTEQCEPWGWKVELTGARRPGNIPPAPPPANMARFRLGQACLHANEHCFWNGEPTISGLTSPHLIPIKRRVDRANRLYEEAQEPSTRKRLAKAPEFRLVGR